MNRFNDWLASKLGDSLSSMVFFYFCVALDLIELKPVIDAHSVITWVTYVSQSVIQLVALPLLGYQNKMQQRSHDHLSAKVKLMHKHVREIHEKVHNG